MTGETQKQFSLARAGASACGRQKRIFVSIALPGD
jgi:hypothetical protein